MSTDSSFWYRAGHIRRAALVVVIDELDRPSEQAARRIHVVTPNFERNQKLACRSARLAPVSDMLKPTLIGSAAWRLCVNARRNRRERQRRSSHAQLHQRLELPEHRVLPVCIECLVARLLCPVLAHVVLFHHFVRRHRAPQIGGIAASSARSWDAADVAMTGPRLEIAERLVLHLVEFGEQSR